MAGEVVIMHQLDGEMVCGSDKGQLGRISISLFEDLELRNTLKIVKLPPGTMFHIEEQPPTDPSSTAPIEEHKVLLDQRIVSGPILIAAGYSHYSGTWYGWLSGKDDYGGMQNNL